MRHLPALLAALALAGCGSGSDDDGMPSDVPAPFDPDQPYEPDVAAAALSATVDNPLFPAPVGAHWVYEATTPDGLEHTEVIVEADTRQVAGATARVMRDTVYLDDQMIEDTWDWYGQDADGNVWYVGEDTTEYEDGQEVCKCGSWEWGVDDALPGVVMLGAPEVGDVYRQEFLAGEAEDYAEVVSVDEEVTVPAGTFTGCLKTRDRSAIDPELDEHKYYCPGVGMVLTEEGEVRDELIEYAGL